MHDILIKKKVNRLKTLYKKRYTEKNNNNVLQLSRDVITMVNRYVTTNQNKCKLLKLPLQVTSKVFGKIICASDLIFSMGCVLPDRKSLYITIFLNNL